MPGGTPGVPSESLGMVQEVTQSPAAKVAEPALPPEPAPELKRYQVMRDGRVMYDGYVTQMKTGRIVDNVTYDIEHIKSQGIVLQEIK